MVPRTVLVRWAVAAGLVLTTGSASAQGVRAIGYAPDAGHAGYGFADEAVRGAYVGAPLSQFPSPNRIVPAPWSYGTYGIPTVSGIREAPVGVPRLTVIESRARPVSVARPAPRILSRAADGRWSHAERSRDRQDGVQVVRVMVPRR